MSEHSDTRTVVYGSVHNLQSIAVTTLDPRKDGYWVMYTSPRHDPYPGSNN